jgi:hypothetical protein
MTTYVAENFIETFSGAAFHFMNPAPEEIHIADIAHALSNQCRYAGHVKKFYSVAEHCVHLYDYAFKNNLGDEQTRLTLLLHDASEAYLSDIARPIKMCIPQYREIEIRIEEAIAKKFDLVYPFPDMVKELDTRILMDERPQVKEPSDLVWGVTAEPLGITLKFWDTKMAWLLFLDRYKEAIGG